ncbi:MAG: LuxR family transcriptional regulator [Chloroflexi bacterium]|nr:MAG: LuxR family transcriptional regulator [Chloroflexota bacterium]MBL1192726.1 LuxR family transcriptional regulator [Chloroflexota bacterium]NOH10018.1 LuxR family transcriptional regulator [Chloroflexota bacterium]
MATPLLTTKLYTPKPRPELVLRSRLIEQLNEGLERKLTLISAPAGFGKTTLLSNWLAKSERPVGWLSLDEGDNDTVRFLTYLIAALQTVAQNVGEGVSSMLQSPQLPATESILTILVNEIATGPDDFILVLDDYHLIDNQAVHAALSFWLENAPSQLHLVIATRQDPQLPLARLRARNQLSELRAADLRFTSAEAAEFLNQAMGLNLSIEEMAALETRTEGWITGLQLAALSLQGREDMASFISSFTGSHHFVLDYLVEEVLEQQPENIQDFLLRSSILERLSGPLCDAVLGDGASSGQETLEYLERANLLVVPLDDQRQWYRYHHLFADLLRQRLSQSKALSTEDVSVLHQRASQWYEDNGLEVEAFQHAVAANDIERTARLLEGAGRPLHFRGVLAPILNWLEALPEATLDSQPALWVTYAWVTTIEGQANENVEKRLEAAEGSLKDAEADGQSRDLQGQIATIRAMLAITQNDVEAMHSQSRRALDHLHPDNLYARTTANWTLGLANQLQGARDAALEAYREAIVVSQASGNFLVEVAATTCLGQVQETENELHLAAESYRHVLRLLGEPPLPSACEAHLGLARVLYQWNNLDAAEEHGQLSAQLAPQLETIDTPAICGAFLARLKLAQGDTSGATALLAEAEQFMRQKDMLYRMSEVAEVQVLALIKQSDVEAAASLADTYELPLSQARVHLAQGDPSSALAMLETWRQEVDTRNWADEQLRVMVLQAVAYQVQGETEQAMQVLKEALAMAEPNGFLRIFIDEGAPMAQLLSEAVDEGIMPDYTRKLLAAFDAEGQDKSDPLYAQPLIDPLSQRELEILGLIAEGLSNRQISERLFLALSTVKGHNRIIFGKLQVQRRTEAVARARELGLI